MKSISLIILKVSWLIFNYKIILYFYISNNLYIINGGKTAAQSSVFHEVYDFLSNHQVIINAFYVSQFNQGRFLKCLL